MPKPPKARTIDATKKAGEAPGNELFEGAIAQLQIDGGMGRVLLNGLLARAGVEASAVTPADLLPLVSEVERRLESVVKPNYAKAAAARLRRFLESQ